MVHLIGCTKALVVTDKFRRINEKTKIPTLSTSALDKSPGPGSPDSDIEMKSTSVKSDIDEMAKLLKDKTKDRIAIFNSALKVCIENNPNALLHEAAEHGKKSW